MTANLNDQASKNELINWINENLKVNNNCKKKKLT